MIVGSEGENDTSANTESDGNEILLTRSKYLIPSKGKNWWPTCWGKSGKGQAPFLSAEVDVGKGAFRSNGLFEKWFVKPGAYNSSMYFVFFLHVSYFLQQNLCHKFNDRLSQTNVFHFC